MKTKTEKFNSMVCRAWKMGKGVVKRKSVKHIFTARKGEEIRGIVYFRKTLIVATTKRVLEFGKKGKKCKTRKT